MQAADCTGFVKSAKCGPSISSIRVCGAIARISLRLARDITSSRVQTMYIKRARHSRSWGRASTLSADLERDASTLAVTLLQVMALARRNSVDAYPEMNRRVRRSARISAINGADTAKRNGASLGRGGVTNEAQSMTPDTCDGQRDATISARGPPNDNPKITKDFRFAT